MTWEEDLPEWNESGQEPPQLKKNEGWQPEEKPPAGWFNWLFNRIYNCIIEIRSKFDTLVGTKVYDVGTADDLHGMRIGADGRLYFWNGTAYVSDVGYADAAEHLNTSRLINGVGFDGGFDITVPVNLANGTANENGHLIFTGIDGTGNRVVFTNSSLRFNPSNGYLSATRFVGSGAGLTDVAIAVSGLSIDADKDWNGKNITNLNQLRSKHLLSVISYPPSNERHTVPTLGSPISPAILVSTPTSWVSNPNTYTGGSTAVSWTVPTNLTTHGVSSLYGFVRITASFEYTSGNSASWANLRANGVNVTGTSGARTTTVSSTFWVQTGTVLSIQFGCVNATNRVSVRNLTVTLLDAYPFGTITSANYATITKQTGVVVPYTASTVSGIVITGNYDGQVVPSSDMKLWYPRMPDSISITRDGSVHIFSATPAIVMWKIP